MILVSETKPKQTKPNQTQHNQNTTCKKKALIVEIVTISDVLYLQYGFCVLMMFIIRNAAMMLDLIV